jgi:hypothetical protein
MEKLFFLGVCALKCHGIFCSSQSCNVPSTQGIGTFHPGLELGPDNECKKILQLCKKYSEKVQQRAIMWVAEVFCDCQKWDPQFVQPMQNVSFV